MSRRASTAKRNQDRASSVWSTALAKLIVMGLSGVLGLLTGRVFIEHFGVDAYAQYGLLTTLSNLLPFADLGVTAAVINAVAGSKDPRNDPHVHRTIVTGIRMMLVAGLVISTAAVVITLSSAWNSVLGNGLKPDGGVVALLCMITFSVGLPLSVAQRVMIGLRRNTQQIVTQALIAPTLLVSVLIMVWLGIKQDAPMSVLSYVATVAVSVICLFLVMGDLGRSIWRSFPDVFRLRTVPSVHVRALAWPFLLTVFTAIANQMQRVMLSHLAGSYEVVQYSLASQLFGVVSQAITAAGIALWPIYAKARAESRIDSPFRMSMVFLAVGTAAGALVWAVSPFVVHFLSDGKVDFGVWLAPVFVLFVALHSAKYPPGMYMTDSKALKFQVLPAAILMVLTFVLSWWLIPPLGATGAVLAQIAATLACVYIPQMLYVRHDLAQRRRAESAALSQADLIA